MCAAGQYATQTGATACGGCAAGSYSTAAGVGTVTGCSSGTLTWLFRNPTTGYYYVNLPGGGYGGCNPFNP